MLLLPPPPPQALRRHKLHRRTRSRKDLFMAPPYGRIRYDKEWLENKERDSPRPVLRARSSSAALSSYSCIRIETVAPTAPRNSSLTSPDICINVPRNLQARKGLHLRLESSLRYDFATFAGAILVATLQTYDGDSPSRNDIAPSFRPGTSWSDSRSTLMGEWSAPEELEKPWLRPQGCSRSPRCLRDSRHTGSAGKRGYSRLRASPSSRFLRGR